MMKSKPRTITIQMDAEMAGLLDAAMVTQGSMSTPTQVARSCMEVGLIRLAVACSHSPLSANREPAQEALKSIHSARIASACSVLKP